MIDGHGEALNDVRQQDRGTTLSSVQAGRGIAALLVVLFHGTMLVQSPAYWSVTPLGGAFITGHSGAYFFFVLSGFIIFWAHDRDIGQPAKLRRYLWKRAVRIYPPLAVTLAIVSLMMMVIGTPPRLADVVQSILLVGPEATSIIAVGWTLFYELLFYVIFAALIANRGIGTLLFAAWAVVCLPVFSGHHYYTSPLNYLFGIGMTTAAVLKKSSVRVPGLVSMCGLALYVGTAIWQSRSLGRQIEPGEVSGVCRFIAGYGLASGLLILGSVELERLGRLHLFPFLMVLGDASYSIYLVHYPVLSLTAKMIRVLPAHFAFFAIVAAGIAAGIIFSRLVEKPLTKYLSGVGRRSFHVHVSDK